MINLSPGNTVRFHSYMNSDVVLGLQEDPGSNHSAWSTLVRRPSSFGVSNQTAFHVEAADGGFRLRWLGLGHYLLWWDPRHPLQAMEAGNAVRFYNTQTIFTYDAVEDGNWFALNNHNKTYVLDVAGLIQEPGTQILSWPWNGGVNQIWRTELLN